MARSTRRRLGSRLLRAHRKLDRIRRAILRGNLKIDARRLAEALLRDEPRIAQATAEPTEGEPDPGAPDDAP